LPKAGKFCLTHASIRTHIGRDKAMTQTVKIAAMIPPDIKAWLQERAAYHGSTLGAELSRACRERMEREAQTAKERAIAAVASAE
jgi:LPS O-antigen subunit length determinant protein (WzzB/FepE family)